MKRATFTVLQFVLFLFSFAIGSFLPILSGFLPSYLHVSSNTMTFANGSRGFEWDGVLLMLALFVLIIMIEALRKRLRSAAPWTALALALAAILGLVMKFGFRDLQP
jgi:cell division protein FtsX